MGFLTMKRIHLWVALFQAAFLCASQRDAQAQRCKPLYEQAFTVLSSRDFRSIELETNPQDLQLKLDTEIYAIFGARQSACEEGAYSAFLERFQIYAIDALRAPKDHKNVKVRAAMAVMKQSPESLDSPQAATEATRFRQMVFGIRTAAQETGMTPLVRQLLEVIESIGPPVAIRRQAQPDVAPSTPQETPQTPPKKEAPPSDSRVERVTVPAEPLPPWAVISIYEIEEHARRKDVGPILGKVQAIINWMKSVAPPTPSP